MNIFKFQRKNASESYFCPSTNADSGYLFGLLHSKICSADEGAPCTLDVDEWTLSVSGSTRSPKWQDGQVYGEKEFFLLGGERTLDCNRVSPHEVRAKAAISSLRDLIRKFEDLLETCKDPESFEYTLANFESLASQVTDTIPVMESVGGRLDGFSWVVAWKKGANVGHIAEGYVVTLMTITPELTKMHLIDFVKATEEDVRIKALGSVVRNWDHCFFDSPPSDQLRKAVETVYLAAQ